MEKTKGKVKIYDITSGKWIWREPIDAHQALTHPNSIYLAHDPTPEEREMLIHRAAMAELERETEEIEKLQSKEKELEAAKAFQAEKDKVKEKLKESFKKENKTPRKKKFNEKITNPLRAESKTGVKVGRPPKGA